MPESIATIDDGIRLRRWTPAGRVRGSFLLLHGMESHSGWFAPVAERLAGAGWASLAHDRTGWGESVGERGHLESYRDFVAETSRIADLALREYGSVRLAGMSWGGMAALYLALRRGWLFDSVHLLNPGFAMAGSRLGRYIPRGVYAFLAGDGRCEIDVGFDAALFTHDPAWRERIEHDPLRVRKTTVSFYVETVKMRRFIMEHAGKRRLPPAWCLLAGGDRMVDNARAAEVCDRSGVRVETIPDRAHSLVLEVPDLVAARLDEQAGEALAAKRSRGKAWIIGGGAIGGAVGTLLAIGGSDVGVLVKPGHLEAIGRDGFILRTGDIARPAGPTLRAAADVGSLPGPPDLVVVAVKSCDTANALRGVSSKIPAGTVILCLQNGIGNEAKVQAALPENPVAAGAICISAEALRVGDILWPDDRGGMAVAPYCGDENRIRGVVAPLLATTGLECAWEEGEGAAARVKWSKLMLNVGFNALNSVTGLSSARLLADREYGKFAVLALREAFLVMRRSGIQALDLPGYPVRALGSIVRAPLGLVRKALAWQAARSTESAFSMRQDVLKGRASTEIDELNGVIVRRGREIGVDTPANERLCALIKKHAAAGWPSGGII